MKKEEMSFPSYFFPFASELVFVWDVFVFSSVFVVEVQPSLLRSEGESESVSLRAQLKSQIHGECFVTEL